MPKNTLCRKETKVHTIDSREVAEMCNIRHDNLLGKIKGYIKVIKNEDSLKLRSQDFFIPSTYINSQNKEQPCYLLTKKGCDMVANKMTGSKGIIFTARYIDRFYKMEQVLKKQIPQLNKKQQLALKIYDGGSDAIVAHKELVAIEVKEETAKLKDGTNKIISAQQVVEMLGIKKLTTTLLHEWFVENGFGEWIKLPQERNRFFQPNQRFVDYIAVKGYSFTGKTVKKNKVKVVYSTEMVDRLLDKHMASIVSFVKTKTGVA